MNSIAFFTDTTALPGLHAALLSMLECLDPNFVASIIIFTDRVSSAEKAKLSQTHAMLPQKTILRLVDYTPKSPEGANSLHGNKGTYGRIYLADLLPDADRCIYLDCDLAMGKPVNEIFSLFDGEHTLFAHQPGTRESSLDAGLFEKANLDPKGPYFNPGVLGLDLRLWRKRGRNLACETVAARYPGMFRSADQALLNVVFHDDIVNISHDFNFAIFPTSPAIEITEAKIYHFVGAPKPWDLFGSRLHHNFALWKRIYDRTAIGNCAAWRYLSPRRTFLISRSLSRAWKKRPPSVSP